MSWTINMQRMCREVGDRDAEVNTKKKKGKRDREQRNNKLVKMK